MIGSFDKRKNLLGMMGLFIPILIIMCLASAGCGGGRSDGLSVSPYNSGTVSGYLYTRISSRSASAVPTGHMPLVGATVTCAGISSTTDTTGKFVLSNVPSGAQACTGAKAGYGKIDFTVNVVPGQNTTALPENATGSVMIPSAAGTLQITSTPPGAAIQIDGVAVGAVTDTTLNPLVAGQHDISVSMSGYETVANQSVTISNGATSSASFTLYKVTTAISISSSGASAEVGATQQFSATCTFSDSSTATCTTSVTWVSSNTSIATISSAGLLTAVSPGTTTITGSRSQSGVTSAGKTITVSCPVGQQWYQGSCQTNTLQTITLSPVSVSVIVGASSSPVQPVCVWLITGQGNCPALTWTSGNTSVATVSNQGVVTGAVAGSTTVYASANGKTSNNVAVTVVPNQLPTATAQANVSSGMVPLTVQFTGSGSDADGTVASYSWVFGDGQSSSQQNPSHSYSTEGVFTAVLTVTDNLGGIGTSNVIVTVTCGASGTSVCLGHASGAAGNAVTVPIKLKNASGVAGVTVVITYNSNVLSVSSVSNGNLIPNALFVSNTSVPGRISIAVAAADGFTGSGDIATINFTINSGASNGMSNVTFNSAELNDTNGASIVGVSSSSGSVTVK